MAKPRLDKLSLRWESYDAADLMNLSLEEFSEWVQDAPDLPAGAIMHSYEVEKMFSVFQLIATAARQTLQRQLRTELVEELNGAVKDLFGPETRILPQVMAAGSGEQREEIVWRPVMRWHVDQVGRHAAFMPVHVVDALVQAVETLCGLRKQRFGVCQAPAVRAPGQPCSKLFLRRRDDAKYCSAACRNRAWRVRNERM